MAHEKKDNCINCRTEFTIRTLKKYAGHCKKCFDSCHPHWSPIVQMDVDTDDRAPHTIGEHRNAWLTYFHDRFETICPICNKTEINVFTFHSDMLDGALIPMCKDCCLPTYRRRHDPLNIKVWISNIGKHAEIECPIGCHNRINVFNFEKGHIVSEYRGGTKTVDNLRPICAPCNKSMGTENMVDYMKRFQK